jgi:hypothetical protein
MKSWALTLLTILLAGCAAAVGNVNAPDEAAIEKLKKQVPIYDDAQLSRTNNYIRVGSIDGYLCFRVVARSSDEEVLMILRKKALDMGANGLTDISCGRGPSTGITCFASRACSATALKVVSPDEAAN